MDITGHGTVDQLKPVVQHRRPVPHFVDILQGMVNDLSAVSLCRFYAAQTFIPSVLCCVHDVVAYFLTAGMRHDGLLCGLGSIQDGCHTALVHHQDAVAHAQDFRQF